MVEDLLPGSVHESAGQEQPENEHTPEQERDAALVQEVVDNFAIVCSVEDQQRRQEDEDLEFHGIDQWLTEHRESRSAHVDEATGQKVPARPTLTINLVESKVLEVVSEARQARLSISVQPKAGLANSKTAGYYKGLIRSIQADSGALAVRVWALERTAIAGRGAYRIEVDYNNDGDFDLDILVRAILNQSTVYWDPYSQLADRSDADWCIITDWMSEAERLRRWPTKPLVPSEGAFEREDHPWFAIDVNKNRSVRIATYYKVLYSEQFLVHHPQLGTVGPKPLAEFPEELQEAIRTKHPSVRVRKVDVRRVLQVICDGTQVLEQDPWLGRYIPVIPTVGKEYNVKGKRSWKGIVANAKDVNRGYNVAISSAVETAGAMPRAPYIMAAGQDEGFEEMWDDSPIKAYVRLYYNPVSLDGKPVPAPQRTNLEPQIQGVLFLARVLKDDIGSLTGRVDPALRAVNPQDRSGKAIDLLQRQGAAGTSNFLDNLATISMVQEGRIYLDLIPKVYDRPGRIVGITSEESDDEKAIMLKRPFVHDDYGNPIPVPCPHCQGKGQMRSPRTIMNPFPALEVCRACQGSTFATRETMPKDYNGQPVEYVDLSEGQFKVSVAIGRHSVTQQEEAMAAMQQLAQAAPPLVPVYADLWVRAMGFPGAIEIADRLKRQNPAAQDDKSGKSLPPEIAAKVQQLQLEHQAAMEQLQKATATLESDAVKMAGQKEIQAMKAEAAEALENLKAQHRLMEQTRTQTADLAVEKLRGQIEAMQQEAEQRHEVLLELLQIKAQYAAAQAQRAAATPAQPTGGAKRGVSVSVSLKGDIADPMARDVLAGAAAQEGIAVDKTPPPPPVPMPTPTKPERDV